MRWSIGIIAVLCVMILSGCTDNSNYYGGIKKTDLPALNIVHEFRGHSDNWGAILFVYKDSSEKLASKELLVYNGKDSKPIGDISIEYTAGDVVGNETITVTEAPEKGIYAFITATTVPSQDSTVKMLVKWEDHSELIELKPVTD
ncbi:hypothetical protein [Paenibacillus sp. V4I7]|uniref:hypothetical protein n=1 Tax=Paenibacillus sp. V4I7 TaxID=3042307 RepID=UPI00278018CD|nr:hypothetical protein [Paenibacillus sp. V4I7]MDQ0899923.1 hypothetical protein [Paenibacillus sp. V4I7]